MGILSTKYGSYTDSVKHRNMAMHSKTSIISCLGQMLVTKGINVRLMSTKSLSFVERARFLEKLKTDENLCRDQLPQSSFLLYFKGKPLLHRRDKSSGYQPSFVDYGKANEVNSRIEESSAILGVDESGTASFAVSLGDETKCSEIEEETGGRFTDLRTGLFLVTGLCAHTLSKGWSLLTWRRKNLFCSVCGAPLAISVSGCSSKCTSCFSVSYPSTSPVGIVSVSDPIAQQLLLIRQPRYPPGMYSCIAGFLDVGETLEDCVRREVAEEVGLEVEKVTYLASQHWPFPAGSLMIGCQAEVQTGLTPSPCKVELEDARWFSKTEVYEAKARIDKSPHLRMGKEADPTKIFIPPKGAIAYELVSNWLNTQS